MEKVLVTSLFDIKLRYPDSVRWRNAKMYIHLFKYFKELDIFTILFVEPHLIKYINKYEKLITIPYNMEDLPAYKLMKNRKMSTVSNGPHLNLEFTSVINSKIFLLNEARKYIINNYPLNITRHLIWLDIGIAHVGSIKPKKFNKNIKLHCNDKIMHVLMIVINKKEILDLKDFLSTSRGNIAAGIMVFPIDKVEWYYNEYYKIFDISVKDYNLMCCEEQIMAVMVGKYPEEFKHSFCEYAVLKNLKYCNNSINAVISNVSRCREYGYIDLGMEILNFVLKSISRSRYDVYIKECLDLFYNGQILSYNTDRNLSYKLGLFIGYLYYNKNEAKSYIDSRYDNIKCNIEFVGLDLGNKEHFNEEKVLQLDENFLLWRII